MTFHLIGLGLNVNSLTQEAIAAIETSKHVYVEGYTVDFPYELDQLDRKFGQVAQVLTRKEVESEKFLKDAKDKDIALLVYGDALSATTHTQLLISCTEQDIPYNVYHNASILTAAARTGLQLYKFGKTASMPAWDKDKKYEPTSFMNYYKENESIGAHTLILTDIGLELPRAIYQLQAACNIIGFEFDKKIIVLSQAGTKKQNIYYESIKTLEHMQVEKPFCLIIPGELHFIEEEALETFKEKIES